MDKYSFDRFVKQNKNNKLKNITRLVVSFLLLSAISYVFLSLGFFKENTTAYYIFVGILATITAYINGYFKKPTVENDGYYDGKITFAKEYISIGDDKVKLEDINKITIKNDDFVGKKLFETHEFQNDGKSTGTGNELILDLQNRTVLEANFKQYTINEFDKLKNILIAYHINHKLTFDELIYILKIEYDIDKNELRKKIKNYNQ